MPTPKHPIRNALLTILSLAVIAVGAVAVLFVRSFTNADLDLAGSVHFENELAVPPLAESRIDPDGTRVFDLTLQRGVTDFGDLKKVLTWGINQSYLGPTLRAERGERVRVDVTNEIGESSTLHWHGMHLPARMDGGPHQMVADGETWSPRWRVDQPAATLWYHPHPHGRTADHVYRGLAGMFLVDDPAAGRLGLPHDYGVDDIPMIIQDKAFADGRLEDAAPLFSPVGFLGDRILVNGTPEAYVEVGTQRVRLRLLNASNARVYNLGFDDHRRFDLVATDGGLLSAPEQMSSLVLSPGERAELVVAFQPGERSVLRSNPTDIAGDFLQQRWSGGDDRLDVMQFRAAERLTPSPAVSAALVEQPALPSAEVAAERTFTLTTPTINGREMDMDRIDETVVVDTTELWTVRNQDGTPHNFHVHDVQFQVVEVDGREPPGHLTGRKDTVFVPANSEVRLLLRFTDYADRTFPYMFHCHLLRHEDRGMMGQFVVVEPGESVGLPPTPHHDH